MSSEGSETTGVQFRLLPLYALKFQQILLKLLTILGIIERELRKFMHFISFLKMLQA